MYTICLWTVIPCVPRCPFVTIQAHTPQQAPKLPVRENDSGQVFVAGLTALEVDSVQGFDKLYA